MTITQDWQRTLKKAVLEKGESQFECSAEHKNYLPSQTSSLSWVKMKDEHRNNKTTHIILGSQLALQLDCQIAPEETSPVFRDAEPSQWNSLFHMGSFRLSICSIFFPHCLHFFLPPIQMPEDLGTFARLVKAMAHTFLNDSLSRLMLITPLDATDWGVSLVDAWTFTS